LDHVSDQLLLIYSRSCRISKTLSEVLGKINALPIELQRVLALDVTREDVETSNFELSLICDLKKTVMEKKTPDHLR
jgi:hypothetical protein